jgi:hypothetical protein
MISFQSLVSEKSREKRPVLQNRIKRREQFCCEFGDSPKIIVTSTSGSTGWEKYDNEEMPQSFGKLRLQLKTGDIEVRIGAKVNIICIHRTRHLHAFSWLYREVQYQF